MKKSKKIIALLMLATMIIGSLAACGKKTDDSKKDPVKQEDTGKKDDDKKDDEKDKVEDVTLKVWGPQEEQELLARMTASFAAAHPEYNIKFEFGVVSEGDAATELTKDPAAAADVFAFASDQTANLVNAGILYPITLNVDAVKAANSEASIMAATVDGQLYAHPFTPNSWFMYYDKSKYTEEEVLSLETMMAKDLGEGVYNFSVDINNGWYLSSFFFAGGSVLFGADGKDPNTVTFNDANGLAVTNYLIDLVANPKFLDEDQGNVLAAFTAGTLGAACSGTWNAEAFKEALGENYAATKLPTIKLNGEDKQLSNFADFKLIGVNSQTKYPIPAMQLAEYLANEENQKLRFEVRSIAPTNLKLASDPVVLANPAVAALSLQTSYSTLQSSIPEMGNYWAPAEAFGNELLSGAITKENAQEKLDIFVDSILSKLN
jgi:arabinogalactan oligomer/maltooligosaccharide transport system substrate-binding protein